MSAQAKQQLFGIMVWIEGGKVGTSTLIPLEKAENGNYADARDGKEVDGATFEKKDSEKPLFMDKLNERFTYIGSSDDCRHFRNGVKIGRAAQHTLERERLNNMLVSKN